MIGEIDPVIHPPKRLAAMAILNNSTSTDFAFLRSHLGCSDSDLSKQMNALEAAGYVSITKTSRGRGGSTTYRITADGKKAFARHHDALRAIVGATVGRDAVVP
jgi:DNA-binding MarR family transcriptional regulator